MNKSCNESLYAFMDKQTAISNNTNYYTPTKESNGKDSKAWTMLKRRNRTKLPNGKHSILVDIGSRLNIVGRKTAHAMSATAARHGHKTKYTKRTSTLRIDGVGAGSAPSTEKVTIPIGVKYQDRPAMLSEYKANIITGSGEDLPALLGLLAMQENDAVIILRKGKEALVMPGPGGYKIEWSQGTKQLPLVPAPSGHLVIPCDSYDEIKTNTTTTDIPLVTDHTTTVNSDKPNQNYHNNAGNDHFHK